MPSSLFLYTLQIDYRCVEQAERLALIANKNEIVILGIERVQTRMYSLTFCVRVMLPERHQWKPAVQTAAVMLRTPPSTASHRQASHAHFPYTARNYFENAPPVTRQSPASSTRRPYPDGRSHYVVISRDGRKLVTRVRVMLP